MGVSDGARVAVCVGGTGVKLGVTGVAVDVLVGGIGVTLGVFVSVGGVKNVADGGGVNVTVWVDVTVVVKVAVTVSKLGVGEGPLVSEGITSGVEVVVATLAVTVRVGVIVPGVGVNVHASQPMQ